MENYDGTYIKLRPKTAVSIKLRIRCISPGKLSQAQA